MKDLVKQSHAAPYAKWLSVRFTAEGDAAEKEESGKLWVENPQPHVGQHLQVQPHPDRAKRPGSGGQRSGASVWTHVQLLGF